MKFSAISDLHIQSAEDPLYQALMNWLNLSWSESDVLVLGGDIFELWLGHHQEHAEQYPEFFKRLQELNDLKVRMYYCEGNHDFHIQKYFNHLEHMTVIEDSLIIPFGDKKIYLAHGDQVNQQDWRYHWLRKTLRTKPLTWVIDQLPYDFLQVAGTQISAWSQRLRMQYVPTADSQQELKKIYQQFAHQKFLEGCDVMVMGHSHDEDFATFTVQDRVGAYFNIGYPRVHGHYIYWVLPEKLPERRLFC
jgi:UDP-2,3-diacylglucosamine hydrolase